jgi:hypothetical protein
MDARVDIVIVIQLDLARHTNLGAISWTLVEHFEGGSLRECQDIKLLRSQSAIRCPATAVVAPFAASWLGAAVHHRRCPRHDVFVSVTVATTYCLQLHCGIYNNSFSHRFEHAILVGGLHLHVRVFASLGNPQPSRSSPRTRKLTVAA